MTAPTQSLSSTLARDWILEVDINGVPTRVRGLSSVSPIFEGSEQDDSDIDSEGFASQIVTGLAFRIEGGGKRKGENTAGFVDDPGQNFLRKKGRQTGTANIVTARIYRRDDLPDAYEAETTVKWTDSAAGDKNALQEFSFTLSGRGKPRDIVKPLVPSGTQVFTVGVGAATAGTFTLTWNGKTTTALAYNATAAAIKAALVALDDGYVAADFTTSGTAPTWSVTVPGGTVTGDGTALTGGALTVVVNP
ncbi:phage tail tube protein [Rhodococcus qingshengii]